jgi:hypothetical protein
MRRHLGPAGVSLLLLLMSLSVTSAAQLRPIAEVPITGDGQVNVGYVGGTGSDILNSTATSSLFFGGSGTLDGYYEDPRILKFSVAPNFTWSHNGGSLGTATGENNEGVLSNVSLFSGGSMRLNFQQSFNRTSTATLFGGDIPVTVGAVGTNSNYSVGWALQKPHLPSLGINYSWGSSDSSVTGVQGPEMTGTHNNFSATMNYMLAKFQLTGMYFRGDSQQQTPDLLNLGIPQKSSSNESGERFELRRNLAKNTIMDAEVEHTDNEYNFFGVPQNTKFDTASAYVSSSPLKRMTVSVSASYSSNATAETLAQALSPSEPTSAASLPQDVFAVGRTLAFSGGTSYELGHGFYLQGTGTDQTSDLPGREQISEEQASVGIYYTHRLWNGMFSGSYTPGVQDIRLELPPYSFSTRALMQVGTASYSRKIGRWSNQGNVSYAHSGATSSVYLPVISESITANLRTSTTLRRRFKASLWMSLNKNVVPGANGTLGQIYSAQVSTRSWSASAQEQINNGYSLVTALGVSSINPTEGAAGVLPQTFYTNSSGLSLTGTYTFRRLSLSSVFSDVNVSMNTQPTSTQLGNKNWDTRLVYRFRKISVQAGYRVWSQSANNNSSLNQHTQAYWFEIVRPFHLF